MASVSCTTTLTLTEQEVFALKELLEFAQSEAIKKYGLTEWQIEKLKGIDKALPDFFRAFNTEKELEEAHHYDD